MSDSMVLPSHGISSALANGPALRWPMAIVLALLIEGSIILMSLPSPRAAVPVAEPAKVMKLVTIADAPAPPEAAPPTPPPAPKKSPPRPAPMPLAKPAPVPVPQQAQPAPMPAQAAPAAEDTSQSSRELSASPATPAAPSAPAAPGKAEPTGAVRRGLVPLVRVEPDYPPRAMASNTEGLVVAHLTIEKDGSVSAVRIVKAQPAKLFDQAATRALMQWKFSQTDGPVMGEVELKFSLN